MKEQEIDIKSLEKILEKTLHAIEKSKEQIFEIVIDARDEKENIIRKLEILNHTIQKVISEVDQLETDYNRSRVKLLNVSKNFNNYSEKDIQNAYETANKLQVELFLAREREFNLKQNRQELQMRLRNIELTIDRAEVLITQVSVVFDFLTNDIIKIPEAIESAHLRQMFGLKILQAQEEERKRVAREIHDGPAQSMANVVLRAEIAERLMVNQQMEMAVKELKDLKTMVRQSLADVRQIIFDLRPMALDDLGLIPTLRKFIPELAKREDLKIELNFTGRERRLPSGMEVAVFRLIQEILNNVIKHAKATTVFVNVEINEEAIKVEIQDNGVGFEKDEVIKNKDHFGLIGMKERIQLLEGEYDIESEKNKGTTVFLQVPIKGGEKSDGINEKD